MVSFVLPHTIRAVSIHVVGDFNQWNRTSHPLWRDHRGRWIRSLILEPSRVYRFRYLIDHEHWLNDHDADAFVHHPAGISSSVIVTDSEFDRYQHSLLEAPIDQGILVSKAHLTSMPTLANEPS